MSYLMADALAEPATPSFKEGFDMLNALVPGEINTRPSASWHSVNEPPHQTNNALREIAGKIKGHGWLIAADDLQNPKFIPFGRLNDIKIDPESLTTPADLPKDVATVIDAISKIERHDSPADFKRAWNDTGATTFGPLMLFAAQLHQSGHPGLADQLAWALFQKAPNREVVIDAAINQLGDSLYQTATKTFFEDHDWQSYHETLTSLIHQLPRGWDMQPAAAMVAESVALQLTHPTPTHPAIDRAELDPAAVESLTWLYASPNKDDDPEQNIPPEVAEMLARFPAEHHAQILQNYGLQAGSNSITSPGFWLLEPPGESHPASPTIKHGISALPAIAALLGDNHPLHFINPASSGSHRNFSHRNTAIERALEMHKSMFRPATRGDIALHLLQPILPDPSNDISRQDPETIRQITLDFHQANHASDRGQIAAAYIIDGSETQKNQAAAYLAKSDEPTHHALFEKSILQEPLALTHLSSVLIYAQSRTTEAKPFLETYLPKVREEIGDASELENMREIPWQLRQPGHAQQLLRQIESLADGKSPEDSAKEIAAGPPEDAGPAIQALLQALLQSISSNTAEEQANVLLAGATAATNPQIRFSFITSIFHIRNQGRPDETAPPTMPEAQRQAWTTLLEDDHPIDPEWESARWLDTSGNIGSLAAMAAEYSIDSQTFHSLNQQTGVLKTTITELCKARLEARLANQPLPALPDPENVTPDRLKEIITTAGSKPISEIHPYLDTLTPDERAAWLTWCQEPGDIPAPESIRQLAVTIIEENSEPQNGIQPTPGLLDLTPGFEFHHDTIDEYIEKIAANASTHSLSFATLRTTDFPPGLSSWTVRAEIPEPGKDDDEQDHFSHMHFTPISIFQSLIPYFLAEEAPENAEALIICQIQGMRSRGTSFNWWVINGTPIPFQISDRGEITDTIDLTIAETLATTREESKPFMIRLQVITRAHAEEIANH